MKVCDTRRGNKPRGSIKNLIFILSERSQWVPWVRDGRWKNISVYPPTRRKTKLWNKHPDFAYSRMMGYKLSMYDFVIPLSGCYLYFTCIHSFVCRDGHMHATAHVWRSECTLSFHHLGFRDRALLVRLGVRYLYLLSHPFGWSMHGFTTRDNRKVSYFGIVALGEVEKNRWTPSLKGWQHQQQSQKNRLKAGKWAHLRTYGLSWYWDI